MHGTTTTGKWVRIIAAGEREGRGAGSRERILQAALRIASVRGYDGTTVKLISEESGLPPSSLYWHFGNKDRLLAAALEHGFVEWGRGLAQQPSPDPGEDLGVAVRHWFVRGLEAVVATPAAWQLGIMLSLQTPVDAVEARQVFVDLHHRVVEAMADWWERVLPPEIADRALARRLSASFLAVLDGLYVAHASAIGWDLEALADRFAAGVVAHLRRLQEEA
jgi:AcrR family transcriptional regulator